MSSQKGSSQRRSDIEANIAEILGLIKDHEQLLISALSPDQKHNAKRRITELRELLASQEAELDRIGHSSAKPSNSDSEGQQLAKAELDKNLREIKAELEQGFDEIKRGQEHIRTLLSNTRNQELQIIIELLKAGNASEEEMNGMLGLVQQSVTILQENFNHLNPEIKTALAQADSALNSEMSLQTRLELTLPIIPLLLDYKVELASTNTLNLDRLWEVTRTWWKSWTTRASRRATQKLLNNYYDQFAAKHTYLAEFEGKVTQSTSNVKILIKAHEELNNLAFFSRASLDELANLTPRIDYPQNELERNAELSSSIANQADSAARLIASNGNPSLHITQIERNIPVLRGIMQELLSWFQQMIALSKQI